MFFCPKSSDFQKKKVFMFTDIHFHSSSLSHDLLLSPQLRLEGGLFSFLEQKSASELQKNMLFCILFRPMGGLQHHLTPPATLLSSIVAGKHTKVTFERQEVPNNPKVCQSRCFLLIYTIDYYSPFSPAKSRQKI